MARRKIPRADDTRPRERNPPKSGCRCRSHTGQPKQQHRTEQAAVIAAARTTGFTGTAYAYQCPTSDRWHVGTRTKGSR